MPKLTAPLFSFGARGSIAKTLTYASWRGIDYVRERVIPANPRTADQVEVRDIFSLLNQVWINLPTIAQTPWTAHATGQPFLNRNAFIGRNLPLMYAAGSNSVMLASPGVGGAPTPTAMVVTPGVDQLAVNLTPAALPTGWTLVSGNAVAIPTQNTPAWAIGLPFGSDTDANPAALVITGLTNTTLHRVFGWTIYTKPNGDTAYSLSIETNGTPT